MTTFKKGINAAGLNQILSSRGPFTVFAPSDIAFGKLDSERMSELLLPKNKVELTSLLNHHVVAGKISFKDLKEGDKLTTLNGKDLSVQVSNGTVSIDGAVIRNHDVAASNGVVHFIDTVLTN